MGGAMAAGSVFWAVFLVPFPVAGTVLHHIVAVILRKHCILCLIIIQTQQSMWLKGLICTVTLLLSQ